MPKVDSQMEMDLLLMYQQNERRKNLANQNDQKIEKYSFLCDCSAVVLHTSKFSIHFVFFICFLYFKGTDLRAQENEGRSSPVSNSVVPTTSQEEVKPSSSSEFETPKTFLVFMVLLMVFPSCFLGN